MIVRFITDKSRIFEVNQILVNKEGIVKYKVNGYGEQEFDAWMFLIDEDIEQMLQNQELVMQKVVEKLTTNATNNMIKNIESQIKSIIDRNEEHT